MTQKKQSNAKSLEQWIWDAACAIRGAKDAGTFKNLQKVLKELGFKVK